MSAKRVLDVGLASLVLLLSAPLLVLLMLVVIIDSPGGAFFTQTRVGRHGRPFTIYKLRTFRRESHGVFPDEEIRWSDPRITRAGTILRRCKLDELPQLWNVICGDMSLIGPRPDIPLQAQSYSAYDRYRLAMRPGMTGLAQVSGNTFLSWPERIRLDLWYIGHYSLWLDVLILRHTFRLMLRGEKPTDDPLRLRSRLAQRCST